MRQRHKFVPRALDNPLQVGQKVSVHGIRTRLEGFDCLLSRGDQDREQGLFLVVDLTFDLAYLPALRGGVNQDSL